MNSICLELADQDICVQHPPVVIPRKAGTGVGGGVDVGAGVGVDSGMFAANEGPSPVEVEGLSPGVITTVAVLLGGEGGTLVAVVSTGVATRRVGTSVAAGPSSICRTAGARVTEPLELLGGCETLVLGFADSLWGLQLVATATNSRAQSHVKKCCLDGPTSAHSSLAARGWRSH